MLVIRFQGRFLPLFEVRASGQRCADVGLSLAPELEQDKGMDELTPRHQEVVTLAFRGMSYARVAEARSRLVNSSALNT